MEIDLDDPSSLMGRTILIGMTYLNGKGEIERYVQVHGIIADIVNWNIVVQRDGQDDFNIPYDKRAMKIAAPGVYRLRETGEEVKNPDVLSTWTVSPPGSPSRDQ